MASPVAACARREVIVETFDLNVTDPSVQRDPYPHYARLRGAGRVVRSRTLGPSGLLGRFSAAYVLHRYEDVRRAFGDHKRLSNARLLRGGGEGAKADPGAAPGDGRDPVVRGRDRLMAVLADDPEARAMLEDPEVRANLRAGVFGATTMLSADPPEHERLRGVVNRAFFPRRVSALEGRIREMAQDLVAPIAGGGEHELMAELAEPLPSIVIAEMLGVPPDDHPRFKEWSDAVVGAVEPDDPMLSIEDPLARLRAYLLSPRRMARVAEFRRYLAEQIERARVERGDNLISRMVEANEAEQLSAEELTAAAFLLLIAGNETTTRLIGNLVLALDRHPDQRELLVGDPTLVPAAVEEGLRFDPPVQVLSRLAVVDVEVGGDVIPAGSVVSLLMAAANRDPDQFPDPDRFDVRRRDNAHISFGYGVHFCLGAPLARRETRIALEELLRAAPSLRVVTPAEQLDYATSMGPSLRGPRQLRVAS